MRSAIARSVVLSGRRGTSVSKQYMKLTLKILITKYTKIYRVTYNIQYRGKGCWSRTRACQLINDQSG